MRVWMLAHDRGRSEHELLYLAAVRDDAPEICVTLAVQIVTSCHSGCVWPHREQARLDSLSVRYWIQSVISCSNIWGNNLHAFNADFYVTTATVIPVLYLSLTLQGTTFERIMSYWRSSNKKAPFTFRGQLPIYAIAIGSIAFGSIVLFSVYGEYLALRALYSQESSPRTDQTVYVSVIALLIITAIGPFIRFTTAYFGTLADDNRRRKEEKYSAKREEKTKQSFNKQSESASIDTEGVSSSRPQE
jgi:hypothetical protein